MKVRVGNQKSKAKVFVYLRMHELAEELLLVHYRVDATLRDNPRLCHFFHRKKFLFLAQLDLPHFAETTSTNDVVKVEVVLINLYSQVTTSQKMFEQGLSVFQS